MPRAASSSAPKKRATKKATTKRVASARKAPTRKPAQAPVRSVSPAAKFLVALIVGALAIAAVSYYIGKSDAGEINVSSVISDKADMQAAKGDVAGSEAIRALRTTSATNDLPNGGLIGSGNQDTRQQAFEKQQQKVDTASSTATSTDETASSTEEVVLEETAGQEEVGQETESGNLETEGPTVEEAVVEESEE